MQISVWVAVWLQTLTSLYFATKLRETDSERFFLVNEENKLTNRIN